MSEFKVKDEVETKRIALIATAGGTAAKIGTGKLETRTESGHTVLYFISDDGYEERLTDFFTGSVNDGGYIWTYENGRLINIYAI